jgi:hypothetical protein
LLNENHLTAWRVSRHESLILYHQVMILTFRQRDKTQSIANNVVGSDQVRAQALHALSHDSRDCPECAAWRGRPDMVALRAEDERTELTAAREHADGPVSDL